MLIHFDSSLPGACPLSEDQSRGLLKFCHRAGATKFTVNFLFAKGEKSEQVCDDFYQRFHRFSAAKRVLENIYGQGFRQQECWVLTEESIEDILKETAGNLLAYDVFRLPEDWLFYLGDAIFLQVVSHEQEATLRLSDSQYAEFAKLGIPYRAGQSRWSALPESPLRTSPAD